MSEDGRFLDLIGGDVTPLKSVQRADLKSVNKDAQTLAARRQAAEAAAVRTEDPLAGGPTDMLDPFDELSFRRAGVQNGVFRSLRQGKYRIDARLDLHKLSVERARQEVAGFVRDCVNHDVRTALITHGKGAGREQPALLKSHVAFWLPQLDDVLAFHTAQRHHGGYGATYVLLRKSERKKQETREQHSRKPQGSME